MVASTIWRNWRFPLNRINIGSGYSDSLIMQSGLEMRRVLIRQLRKAIQNGRLKRAGDVSHSPRNTGSARFGKRGDNSAVVLPETEGDECFISICSKEIFLRKKRGENNIVYFEIMNFTAELHWDKRMIFFILTIFNLNLIINEIKKDELDFECQVLNIYVNVIC